MNPDRWLQVKSIFAAALECEPAQREAFIATACGDDAAMRAEVESLLRAHVEDDFIEQPAAEHLGWAHEHTARQWIGRRIGPYRIVGEAGRGGMSQVFKAVRDDAEYEQQVAIKLLRWELGSESLLRRFKAERQILAKLQHPNIAHLLDGGATEEGAPYLVMEYIEGQPIDEYCERSGLDLSQRLELFRSLCSAVHYVHQHLMVHGDLKGANVLVTEAGVVKLLDFGIAKLLDTASGDPRQTRATTLMMLTPEYASPEQVRGEPLTTASDVYSLGALLYRLVTGGTPFKASHHAPLELATQIAQADALAPSKAAARAGGAYARFARALEGDLDTIILKALKKAPQERYGSVEQLAADIQRYLRGFPVEARPDNAWYLARKFIARHRAASIAITLFTVALIGGIVATSWQAHIARQERARAERHFNHVRELSAVFLADVYEAVKRIPGSTEARKLLVDNTIKYLSALAQEAGESPQLQRELGRAYEVLGDVQGASLTPSLGEARAALESYRRSLEIRQALAQSHPGVQSLGDALLIHQVLMTALREAGEMKEALATGAQALQLAERVLAMPEAGRVQRRYAAATYLDYGAVQWNAGDAHAALNTLERARVLYQALLDEQPDDLTARRDVALSAARVGEALHQGLGELERAVAAYEEARMLLRPVVKRRPLDDEPKRMVAHIGATLGELHNALRRPEKALTELTPALKTLEDFQRADAADQFTPLAVAQVLIYMGDSYFQLRDYTASERAFRRADSIVSSATLPPIPEIQLGPGTIAAGIARANLALARTPEQRKAAYEQARRAASLLTPLASDERAGAQARKLIAEMERISSG